MALLPDTIAKVQRYSDVELAMLLSLLADQHCVVHAVAECLETLLEECRLICENVFGLSHTVVRCNCSTTLDDFREGLLVERQLIDRCRPQAHNRADNPRASRLDRPPTCPSSGRSESELSRSNRDVTHCIPNVILVEGLSLASNDVQIQALELLRTRRIFSHAAVHRSPKPFLVVFLKKSSDPRHTKHLNEHLFLSHQHEKGDLFKNLEDASHDPHYDQTAVPSVVHHFIRQGTSSRSPSYLCENDIKTLRDFSERATMNAEVLAYQHNIITFLRLHRAVAGGISPKATQHFSQLLKCLCSLHGLEYVTPSLVALAARKIYAHRIEIATVEDERSMQYGSHAATIRHYLSRYDPEVIIDEVLAEVETPL